MVNADEPMIPLPNVGEGGPVYPGNMDTGVTDPGQVPVIPLPNPGAVSYTHLTLPTIGG